MSNFTAEQIARICDQAALTGREWTVEANKMLRAQDQSHLWPIRGRFSATERAIKRVRKLFSESGDICEGLAYVLAVESEESEIVNNERNW